MRSRVIAALILSCVLVIGALYVRLTSHSNKAVLLPVATETDVNSAALDKIVSDSPNQPAGIQTRSLTPTDSISQNLFSDYVNLKANNELTDDNVAKLGDIYSSRILLDTATATSINESALTIIPDSAANLSSYSQAMLALRSKYESESEVLSKQYGFNDNLSDPNFAKLMDAASKLYAKAALELKSVPVPSSLAANHVALVNLYLSNSTAMEQLGGFQDDPMKAFSAISALSKNTQQEDSLYNNIRLAEIQQTSWNNL